MLRRIEYEPSTAPQTLSAVRSLERARRKHAAEFLVESRSSLNVAKTTTAPNGETSSSYPQAAESREEPFSSSRPLSSIAAPPPISEVLQDIYPDENTTVQ
jgi:hypothetical protein